MRGSRFLAFCSRVSYGGLKTACFPQTFIFVVL